MHQFLAACRFLLIIPVLGCVILTAGAVTMGMGRIIGSIGYHLQNPDFSEKASALEEAANAFAELAASGDQATTLGGLRSLGGTCGNCHDSYRVDDD